MAKKELVTPPSPVIIDPKGAKSSSSQDKLDSHRGMKGPNAGFRK